MKFRQLTATTILGLSAWIFSLGSAQASTVIYDGVGFLTGTQSFTDSFSVATAGTVTVTLSNIAFPEELASLSLMLSSPSGGALGSQMQAGTESFHVQAGDVFAQWFGTAQGPMNSGVYALKIAFDPASSPVPLPTSIALLLSGLGLMAWQRRTRSSSFAGSLATPNNR
jgi:hypothetical protein